MADYIYLLETRLTPAQQRAIATIRTVAREQDYTVFLTGGAVRDMTGGGSIRDLDLTVQGNALLLKEALQAAGATLYGEEPAAQRLFLSLPSGVRAEVSSAMSVTFPKPGKPDYQPAALTDDLRSRDFTANAMAISLNEGSYGLLMDPLNGVADIENRELRLVSNYGFIEDPSRLIRAARLRSRLGWQFEERTGQRYDTAKEEGYIGALSAWNRGYELEEVFHEEDPVRIMRALETEGWLTALSPALTPSKANMAALNDVAERQGQLQMQGVFAQTAALTFPLVTAKASVDEVAGLKALFVRPGFVEEIDTLEAKTREFGGRFSGKEAAAPSAAWRMLREAEPNLVLSLAHSSKAPSLQGRLKTFLNESPNARQRIPYVLMQEMRITPDLPGYDELVDKLFFELMDGKLSTVEEMKAYLEPYSPPAPPPPVNLRRARAKKEARPSRAKGKKAVEQEELPPTVAAEEEAAGVQLGLMEPGTLTGPDRGPEPSPREPLAGKEAPEPDQVVGPEEPEPLAKAPEAAPTPAPLPARKGKVAQAPVSKPAASPIEPAVPSAPAKVAPKGKSAEKPAPTRETALKSTPSGVRTAVGANVPPPPAGGKAPAKQPATKQAVSKPVAAPAKQAPVKAVVTAAKAKPAPTAKPAAVTPSRAAAPAKAAVPARSVAKAPAKASQPAKPAVKTPAKVAAKAPVTAKVSAVAKKTTAATKNAAPVKAAVSKGFARTAVKAPAKAAVKVTAKTTVKAAAKTAVKVSAKKATRR